jgi:UDP-N-acetylglucosamine acyltransferase
MKSEGLYNDEWINIDGNNIHKTAIIHPNVTLGKGNTIGAYAVIGSNGEMRNVNQDDFKGKVVIGDNNVISEFVSIQRPFNEDESTFIGNDNIIMAHSHIGHNAFVGDYCEICTNTVLGGYAVVNTGSKLKISVTVRNRKVIGKDCIIGMGSNVTSDIPDKSVAFGNPAKIQH